MFVLPVWSVAWCFHIGLMLRVRTAKTFSLKVHTQCVSVTEWGSTGGEVWYLRLPCEKSYTYIVCRWCCRNIYAAIGVYRLLPPTSWPITELETQVEISRDSARRDLRSLGNVLFSAKYFRDDTGGVRSTFTARVYTKNARVPATPGRPTNLVLWTVL